MTEEPSFHDLDEPICQLQAQVFTLRRFIEDAELPRDKEREALVWLALQCETTSGQISEIFEAAFEAKRAGRDQQ